ncbi:MAG TPA: hypothetical protein VFV86_05675 [Nitrososphaeraceae archaeon]|nr:hypothetical protein [Nitrososphaeraceae archaeon]
MKEKNREIRIKPFQTHSFDSLINQVNRWLSTKQKNNSEVFDLIDVKYQSEHSTMSDKDLQYTAIAIYRDSIENLNKETEIEQTTSSDEEFISQKKKLEYRK